MPELILVLPSKLLVAAPTEFDITTLLSINERYSWVDDKFDDDSVVW